MAHRDLGQLMPYLHLPVQSGSDHILAAMNRRHSRAEYLRVLDRLRAAQPEIGFDRSFREALLFRDIDGNPDQMSAAARIATEFARVSVRAGWLVKAPGIQAVNLNLLRDLS